MAMSKKDYEAVARIISDERLGCQTDPAVQQALSYVVSGLASYMQAGNPRFDRQRFVEAASLGAAMARREN